MISSMTGYATHTIRTSTALITLDLRSVNQRYLEIAFRLPDELRVHEAALREGIVRRLGRGKVECRISQTALTDAPTDIGLNPGLLESLRRWQALALSHFPAAAPLSVADILRWNGMLGGARANDEEAPVLLAGLEAALDQMTESRQREGEKLEAHIRQRLEACAALLDAARKILPDVLDTWRAKLAQRLREALGNQAENEAGADRLTQEFALFAQKVDVDEELSRFTTHIDEVRRTLDKGGTVGKRLDFLMQEMHREANTLGSKSISSETTRISVELKVLVEQMREQIQNIE